MRRSLKLFINSLKTGCAKCLFALPSLPHAGACCVTCSGFHPHALTAQQSYIAGGACVTSSRVLLKTYFTLEMGKINLFPPPLVPLLSPPLFVRPRAYSDTNMKKTRDKGAIVGDGAAGDRNRRMGRCRNRTVTSEPLHGNTRENRRHIDKLSVE